MHVNGGMQGLTMTTGMEVGPQRQGPELEELSLKIRAATKERRRARRERERGEGGDGEVGGLEEGSSGDGMPRVNGERRD